MKIIDFMTDIKAVRLPTPTEWDKAMDITGHDNKMVNYNGIASWLQEEDGSFPLYHMVRGYFGSMGWFNAPESARYNIVGFRPVFDLWDGAGLRNGEIVVVGSLYAGGRPVRVMTRNTWAYKPGDSLEFRQALENPDYQVKAIAMDGVLFGGRNLLRAISWADLAAMQFCRKREKMSWDDLAIMRPCINKEKI